MEFYKVIIQQGQYQLEEEAGQQGCPLTNGTLEKLAALLYQCYQKQEHMPLRFRRYLTLYHADGTMEYVALENHAMIAEQSELDGFATTWLEGEEENRVWIGADGAIENRGPSTEKVKDVLELLFQALTAISI